MLAVELWIAAALTLAFAGPSQAQSPAAQRGLTFVRTNCAQCHAIDKVSPSPSVASRRRSAACITCIRSNRSKRHWPKASGSGHPTMPEFRLDPGQIGDVIAYLKTLAMLKSTALEPLEFLVPEQLEHDMRGLSRLLPRTALAVLGSAALALDLPALFGPDAPIVRNA